MGWFHVRAPGIRCGLPLWCVDPWNVRILPTKTKTIKHWYFEEGTDYKFDTLGSKRLQSQIYKDKPQNKASGIIYTILFWGLKVLFIFSRRNGLQGVLFNLWFHHWLWCWHVSLIRCQLWHVKSAACQRDVVASWRVRHVTLSHYPVT